ncbi:MAG: thiamine pyrophosphate-dependent enzyme [Planctomycetota bacterium]
MRLAVAIQPIADFNKPAIIVTTMATVREWPADKDGPHVFHYVPSSMGQGVSLGLGLALARPERRVIVIHGDGSTLMNLGSLVTIGHCQPRNYVLVVVDNGIYEVTGGQPHGGAGNVDFVGMAKACSIADASAYVDPSVWAANADDVLSRPGPVFISLKVEPRMGQPSPKPRRPMADQIHDLRRFLGIAEPA